MDSQLLYQQDVTILEFTAQVLEILKLSNDRSGVILDHTYFYPTGGGQEHDTGTIGAAKVNDVFKDENQARLVHVIEGEVGLGQVQVHIDADRRLRHMQHHTAQHLLTQCILRTTGIETVSANINGYSPSTLDIVAGQLDKMHLDQAELMANKIIYDDLQVKTYFVTPEELQSIPLRRPPKVTENIRIVEIDGFDYSPCGGTHVLQTGTIGLIKVLRTERMNDKLRIHFIAGIQAMELFNAMFDAFTEMANRMSTAWQDIPGVLGKQVDQLNIVQKELQSLRISAVKYEAAELEAQAQLLGDIRMVRADFQARPVPELRMLGEVLRKSSQVVACLTSYDGQKISLVVTCGENTGKDARNLLNQLLARINGHGGGDSRLAQGGGTATIEQYRSFLLHLASELEEK